MKLTRFRRGLRALRTPHGRNAFLKRLEMRWRLGRIFSKPINLVLEITNRCNLKCIMCTHSFMPAGTKFQDMEVGCFEKLIPVLPYAKAVGLSCWGESLLARDEFDYIFKTVLNYPQVQLHLITNGMLLDECLALGSMGKNMTISVSFDAADRQLFERIRVGANYDKVVANIKMFASMKQRHAVSLPQVNLWFTLMKRNLSELIPLIELAKGWGINAIICNPVVVFREELRGESLFYCKELANERCSEARVIAQKVGLTFIAPEPFRLGEEATERRAKPYWQGCPEAYSTILLKPSGEILPCCLSPASLVMGDLNRQGLYEIWYGAGFRGLRRSLRDGNDVPPDCLSCHGPQRDINNIDTHIKIGA